MTIEYRQRHRYSAGMEDVSTPARFWYNRISKDICSIITTGIVIGAIGVIVWAGHKVISASGQADYCIVRANTFLTDGRQVPVFQLETHVPWRADRTIGTRFATLDDAAKACELIGLKIR